MQLVLLIVPYGIEILVHIRGSCHPSLLIVPYGIEINLLLQNILQL